MRENLLIIALRNKAAEVRQVNVTTEKEAETDLFNLERTYISILRPVLNRDASTVIFRTRHPDPDLEGD